MGLVKEYFELDNDLTRKILSEMIYGDYLTPPGGKYDMYKLPVQFNPDRTGGWTANPIDYILSNDDMWALYVHTLARLTGKQPTMSGCCDSLLICGFYILDNNKGPEGDGARQMMRKHWYAWLKAPLQKLAVRLGKSLMENGTPDSESLNALISKRVGEWNEKGLLEYRQVWIENNTTKFMINPNAIDEFNIVICCEKDAAFAGVCLSAMAMGALAVYSGGGKSSRAGIEKLYYACLKPRLRSYDSRLIVLTISDYDTDGESVIAPTFTEQLSTYIDRERIDSVRVGVDPAQVTDFGYEWAQKEYEVKYNVGDGTAKNYLVWCGEKAIMYYSCESCGDMGPHVGGVCGNCGFNHLPDEEPPTDKEDLLEWKKEYLDFYQTYSPKGFELDALTRVDYCALLVTGLTEIINFSEFLDALSAKQEADSYNVGYNLANEVLNENASFQEITKYADRLQEWFRMMTEKLTARQNQIRREVIDELRDLASNHFEDERVKEDDPYVEIEDMIKHMQKSKFNLGRCNMCYLSIDQCRDPENHKARGYFEEVPEDQLFDGVEGFQPYSRQVRDAKLLEVVKDEEGNRIQELKDLVYEYPTVDIQMDDEGDDGN